MTPDLELLSHQIVSAVFNGVYQGALVAVVVWLAFKLFRKMSATTRHAIGFVALLAVAALPVFHFVNALSTVELSGTTSVSVEPVNLSVGVVEPIMFPVEPRVFEARAVPENLTLQFAVNAENTGADELKSTETVSPTESNSTEVVREKSAAIGDFLKQLTPVSLAGEVPTPVALFIVVAIGVLGLWRLGWLGAQFVCLNRLKRNDVSLDDVTVEAFDRIVRESGCRRSVRLLSSDEIHTPIAIGYLDPVVMLPADLVMVTEPAELDAVLRHEIAHINRRDDWFNLVQQFVAATCFFNPAIAWLSDRLTMDRELACDDHALSRSDSPEEYALTLTEFAGRSRESRWIAAPAAWNSKSQLKERINMILDPNRNTSLKLGKTSAGILAIVATGIAGAAFLTAPRLVLAEPQSVVESRATPASSDDIFSTRTTIASKPPRDASPLDPTASDSYTSDALIDVNPSVNVVNEPRLRNRERSRSSSSFGGNPGTTAGRSDSIFSTLSELDSLPSSGVVVVQSSSTLAPTPVAPVKPVVPRRPQEPVHPPVVHVQTHSARFDGHRDRSLEQRLEQLERKLAEMTSVKPRIGSAFEEPKAPSDLFGGGDMVVEEWPNPYGEEQRRAIEVAVDVANQQVAVAMEQVEISNQQIERQVRKQVSRNMEQGAQRSALKAQKRALEKQMRQLDQQMKQLRNEMHSLEEQLHDMAPNVPNLPGVNPVEPKASF